MKTVPSLVGASTLGIAVVGLALAKPERVASRPASRRRMTGPGPPLDLDFTRRDLSLPLPRPRPGTSAALMTPEIISVKLPTSPSNPPVTMHTQYPTLRNDIPPATMSRARRLSLFLSGESSSQQDTSGEENKSDSASSRGSWMRRLSSIPNSYTNSPRSSVGPDSPSLQGSAAPILSDPNTSPTQLPPNKLVKRAPSGRARNGSIIRTKSKSNIPLLRRPATSHQRSVTLQQQFIEDSATTQQAPSPPLRLHIAPLRKRSIKGVRTIWHRYFEPQTTRIAKDRVSGKSSDGSLLDFQSTAKRIIIEDCAGPTLVKPTAIQLLSDPHARPYMDHTQETIIESIPVRLPSISPMENTFAESLKEPIPAQLPHPLATPLMTDITEPVVEPTPIRSSTSNVSPVMTNYTETLVEPNNTELPGSNVSPLLLKSYDEEAAEFEFPSSPPSFSLATKEFSRLSLDDEEEDEDWTRDDEDLDISSPLSPPSSSLNSQRVSASFRAALADVTLTNGNSTGISERPKSNLFDWSEPSVEKMDYMAHNARPKTAHVQHIADGRGARTVGRRGPSAVHIRSQSVPVVPDGSHDGSKMPPKFGTWGSGAKAVSEDWDDDFDFGNNEDDTGDNKGGSIGMIIPPTIQASQEVVVGHVGQIREICLLVEDLKRLRLLAKEKDMLNGPSAPLWNEAEGIIALAVPDEEDMTLSPPRSPSAVTFEREMWDGHFEEDFNKTPHPLDLDRTLRSTVLRSDGSSNGLVTENKTVRRKSVFSPEDDIFGAGPESHHHEHLMSPPQYGPLGALPTSLCPGCAKNASAVARSVMETMHQHRAISDPIIKELSAQASNKMPFDTTSLRDLVHRAGILSRTLSDLIRRADSRSPSPDSIHRESSPAFVRVFTDPHALLIST